MSNDGGVWLIFDYLGFDGDNPPSKMDMMKLIMDKEFREAAQTVCSQWGIAYRD